MSSEQKETEMKEIPTPKDLRDLALIEVDLGSVEFLNTITNARNKIINAIESSDPTELQSIVIYSALEGSLDIIKPILINNFKEKGWQLDIGVVESENLNNKNFDQEFAICQILEIDTRSLLSRIFHVDLVKFIFSSSRLPTILSFFLGGYAVYVSSQLMSFGVRYDLIQERKSLIEERDSLQQEREQLEKEDEIKRITASQRPFGKK